MKPITIGSFHYDRGTYQGRIQTLGIDAPLCFVPANPLDEKDAPEWRLHLGEGEDGPAVGEGRSCIAGPFGFHIAVLIDGPICLRPIEAMLIEAGRGGVHLLVWNGRPAADRES